MLVTKCLHIEARGQLTDHARDEDHDRASQCELTTLVAAMASALLDEQWLDRRNPTPHRQRREET